jgi:hypothetical protein
MARRKASRCPECEERRRLEREEKRQSRNAEAYNLVQKIRRNGRRNISGAVNEAAEVLGYSSDTSIWTSIREHKRELERQAQELEQRAEEARKSARSIRIMLGEEEPTDEEMEAAADQHFGLLDDLRKGK